MTTEQLLQHKALNNPQGTIALFAEYFGQNIAEMAPSGIVHFRKESVAIVDKKGKPVLDEAGEPTYDEREVPVKQSADVYGVQSSNFLLNTFGAIKSGAYARAGLKLENPYAFKLKLFAVPYNSTGHSQTLGDEFQDQEMDLKTQVELAAEFGSEVLLNIVK